MMIFVVCLSSGVKRTCRDTMAPNLLLACTALPDQCEVEYIALYAYNGIYEGDRSSSPLSADIWLLSKSPPDGLQRAGSLTMD